MDPRTTRRTVTFVHPFRIADYEDELPAGDYQVVMDEELLEGRSFEAYRRTGTYLLVGSQAGGRGTAEMRPIDPRDLEAALVRDRAPRDPAEPGEAALAPLEVRS
ncbi:hypothetical protein Rumeso_04899 [Rubellimicrobium mesophilum DSM 19309]|uniref:Uncharacterized protein n=1 Tax=Rubellimicrobium mesophilum DSM 19309 TaxID=442562 RepID=A0A017HBI5_9RHOB|nr:hypothetical protein [Rubellimicrobium mesophilum]EYD71498.1 hypothetical protein Rumeso_04899 [Rubellimicrobium mesophilum DSM 19309]